MLASSQLLLFCQCSLVALIVLLRSSAGVIAGPTDAPSYFAFPNAVRDVQAHDNGRSHIPLVASVHQQRPGQDRTYDDALRLLSAAQSKRSNANAGLSILNSTQTSAANKNDASQAIGYLGYAYYASLNLSMNDPQPVFVQLDTGSSDLWVVSASCQSSECATDVVLKFDESKSDSFAYLELSQAATASSPDSGSNVTVTAQRAQFTQGASSLSKLSDSGERRKRRDLDTLSLGSNATNAVPFTVAYDDGTVAAGALAQEYISLANLSSSGQVFGLVTETNVTLSQQGISGVLGLGFPRGSAIARSLIGDRAIAHSTPFLSTILSESNSSYPLFTLFLNSTKGRMTIGAADSQILGAPEERAQVEWHDVVPFPSGNTGRPANATVNMDAEALNAYLYWAIELSSVGFNGSNVSTTPTYSEVGNRAIALLDSGTPGIVGPWDAVEELFRQIEGARHVGAGRYVVPCTTQVRMFFNFGGLNYTLLPSDYIIGPASGNPYLCLSWPTAARATADGVDWVLGLPFLQAQYSLFSLGIAGREAPKIGLYPLRAAANATEGETFAPEDAGNLSSFLSRITPVATTLPNSIVTLPTPSSTSAYVFENATTTPSLGLIPTNAQSNLFAPSSNRPLLTAQTGNVDLPILSSTVSQFPIPSNPAERQSNSAPSLVSFASYALSLSLAFSSILSFL